MCSWLITLICFSLFGLLFTAFDFFSLWETTQTLFWASFGLIDLDNFELAGIKEFTRFWGLSMFGSFSVINIIVLLNLLIAMMNHSYQLISVSSVSFRTMLCLILPHVQQQSLISLHRTKNSCFHFFIRHQEIRSLHLFFLAYVTSSPLNREKKISLLRHCLIDK